MRRVFRLYKVFISQHLKRLMEYKIDFLTGALSFFILQAVNILFLSIIFSQIPNLKGWSFEEIIFIYGFSLIPKGLDHLLTDNLWKVAYFIVQRGEFDKYLTRPINTLFHVIVEEFQIDALGELIMGIALIASVVGRLGVTISPLDVVLMLIVIPFAALIYTSIKTITAAIAFWTKRSGHITQVFYMMSDFAKYPTKIYNNVIRNLITYVVPFAFTAFYPASYFLTKQDPFFNIGLPIIISSVMFCISILIWNRGIKAYESAGS